MAHPLMAFKKNITNKNRKITNNNNEEAKFLQFACTMERSEVVSGASIRGDKGSGQVGSRYIYS